MTPQFSSESPATQLRQLIDRKDRVLCVLHPPSATLLPGINWRGLGCEVGFVGVTGGVALTRILTPATSAH